MKTFLITSKQGVSEWITDFTEVQIYMNNLQSNGVNRAKVQCFEDNVLTLQIKYKFNGERWRKVVTPK